ncbi:flagellar M-ring protein FliF [Ochrobactrum sp. MYb15]|uniref:flagellar basal-body MS-ring/collar protein FliF n=1 Tax=Brucella TaxID=234 RepID=UPI00055F803D|nr:flagellar basal-body MS-ring/collar protein FliF [Brucella rhizosphaerae]PQZ48039.1 flagellar M-ring protein FliF [Ochrobactrum sp. MYb19]PRA49546.1 flagellar M-ring protein FliF [Ochrobactrum sp. MYb68]PRA64224.1 flagellar M-ring protein FliF [Ochrobactrum sp. MYb18]PRA75267.1 flagellar M-ring protein FliF [Brucella thiophenivorans]PRA89523.1 flagellar M-ring protein FliF [Ochrobactrum sp. MYb14]PRA96552.1 flagellar M-ring protein FliF [Ochrobactrum sp. MYb15]
MAVVLMQQNFQQLLEQLKATLGKLGARKLIALGLVGAALMGAILYTSVYLSRPSYETLYVGLSRDDVNRMGLALGEAGIAFDVKSDGSSILVPIGKAEQARMYLAEKGLPTSNNAGYELFDNMGSLGLTSFMQEITHVRALEGEIARTIQAIRGVKAARVHIVLAEKGSFRRGDQKPSASVVIRAEGGFAAESAQSIRQLVAAAVPSLDASSVTVLDTNGRLLASAGEAANGAALMTASLEQQVAANVDESIRKALAPYLGIGHFQSSVQASLDTDRRQTNETSFDPESRVERSVRVVRESGDSRNSRNDNATGVEQNIPQEEIQSRNGDSSTEKTDRREELTNYEMNTKTVSTVSDGYAVKRLSIAVVIDQARLLETAGTTPPPADFVDQQILKIRDLVATAAGLNADRGDVINVTAVNFLNPAGADMDPVSTPWSEQLMRQSGSYVNALAILGAVALLIWFGVRPLLRDQNAKSAGTEVALREAGEAGVPNFVGDTQQAIAGEGAKAVIGGPEAYADQMKTSLSDLRQRMRMPAKLRLEQMIEMDEERVAAVLKQWIHETAIKQEAASTQRSAQRSAMPELEAA